MVLMLVLGGLGLAELNETVRELAHGAARKRRSEAIPTTNRILKLVLVGAAGIEPATNRL